MGRRKAGWTLWLGTAYNGGWFFFVFVFGWTGEEGFELEVVGSEAWDYDGLRSGPGFDGRVAVMEVGGDYD